MAETPSKRQRDETQMEDFEDFNKRQKSYNHILSILESEEDEPTQDLSSLITTFQQEISSDSGFDPLPFVSSENDQENPTAASTTVEDYASSSSSSSSSSSPSAVLSKEDDQENDKERVMRHLLEASDDELGIPNREIVFDGENGFNGGDGFSFSDGLWELEDEAANYYTLLQSELFM